MRHESQLVPVTALAFFQDDFVLAGEGCRLQVYRKHSGGHTGKDHRREGYGFAILTAQAIHGIVVHEDQRTVIVWGGKSVRLLELCYSETSHRFHPSLGEEVIFPDWILDAAFEPGTEGTPPSAALVSAHNGLSILWRSGVTANRERPAIEVDHVVPGSNCILYSGHVTWLSSIHCLIAAGTAFGDIIVWSALLREKGGNIHVSFTTHYDFSAHEGSVFGVRLSMVKLPGRNYHSRVLASCSDDRTVQIWDVSELTTNVSQPTSSQRETGFGSRTSHDQEAPPRLGKTMGHLSRIWQVRFLPGNSEKATKIISFGEDASNIEWNIKPSEDYPMTLPFVLEKVCVETAHAGKNIWSVALDSGTNLLATGSADGATVIRLKASPSQNDVDLGPTRIQVKSHSNIRAYTFLCGSQVFAVTDTGTALILDVSSCSPVAVSWSSLTLPDLRGHSIVASISGSAFVAGRPGAVYVYSSASDELVEVFHVERKVAGLFVCAHKVHLDLEIYTLLITTVGSQNASLVIVDKSRLALRGFLDHPQWTLALPPGLVVTSFKSVYTDKILHIILGARNGDLVIYRVAQTPSKEDVIPLVVYEQVHGKDAITALQWSTKDGVERFDPANSPTWIYSTGRDGTFAIHEISCVQEGVVLRKVHQLALPFGPNIEGLDSSSSQPGLCVWGFKSKEFVMYDILAQREIMSVECGGAHRNWALSSIAGRGTFMWTKASAIYRHIQEDSACYRINAGGHGREIKASAVSPCRGKDNEQILATGAEDTNIKLWARSYLDENREPRCIHTMRKHNTGIQALQWSDDGNYLFSSGGFEEFFVWRIAKGMPKIKIGVVCESAHPRSGLSDLRILGFDVSTQYERKRSNCDSSSSISYCYGIFMAYSDSTVRVWEYSSAVVEPGTLMNGVIPPPQYSPWTLLSRGDYLTACLTQARFLNFPVSPSLSQKLTSLYLTAGTDGHIGFWAQASSDQANGSEMQHQQTTAGQGLRWITRHCIHQSTIHSLAVHEISTRADAQKANQHDTGPNEVIIVTGGDDNAIGITRASISTNPSINAFEGSIAGGEPLIAATHSLIIPNAHAAAVTSVAVFPLTLESELLQKHSQRALGIVSVSIDQRVKVWALEFDVSASTTGVGGWRVTPVKSKEGSHRPLPAHTPVADASSLEVLCANVEVDYHNQTLPDPMKQGIEANVLVCGVGMDILSFRVQ